MPLKSEDDIFLFTPLSKAVLYVPKGTKAAYRAADVWKDFNQILELSGDIVLGDVTGDCSLDYNDVIALIDYILGRGDLSNEAAADVNEDKTVDIADVAMLISLINDSLK